MALVCLAQQLCLFKLLGEMKYAKEGSAVVKIDIYTLTDC